MTTRKRWPGESISFFVPPALRKKALFHRDIAGGGEFVYLNAEVPGGGTSLLFQIGEIGFIHSGQDAQRRPLEAFPLLLDATPEQRAHYEIGIDGDDIRWDDIDEDIHISSFFVTAEPDTNNPIAEVFRKFPQLNVSEVARTIGINKSLLSHYIYGIKKPSAQRTEEQKLIGRTAKRELSKVNYRIHTDAIKQNLIPTEVSEKQISFIYANEADVLNVALFGMTAKEWRVISATTLPSTNSSAFPTWKA